MIDDYIVKRYIPKKYHEYINEIRLELDFDHVSNRNKYRYTAFFFDGSIVSSIGIKQFKSDIKAKMEGGKYGKI